MKAYAVIGAAFGDEGKGLMTDYLSANQHQPALVVRCNGGAQAGHTVQTPDGRRHVFKHIGSGAFAGCATYLSEFFICNPILLRQECEQLIKFALSPQLYVDAQALVTTPYDMMLNQIAEEQRASAKHGSCGVGINETVERNLHAEFALRVGDLADRKTSTQKLRDIQQYWVPARLSMLGLPALAPAWQNRLRSADIFEFYLTHIDHFNQRTQLVDKQIIKRYASVIFEGAQGLLLDEEKGFFPHVTRSDTGLKNIITLMQATGLQTLDVFYMARAYLTRHGNGPLPFEIANPHLPYRHISDKTNVPNPHQGALRFAWFNPELLRKAISADLADGNATLTINPNLVITCLDQVDSLLTVVQQEQKIKLTEPAFMALLSAYFPDYCLWTSHGPTRATLYPFVSSLSSSLPETAMLQG